MLKPIVTSVVAFATVLMVPCLGLAQTVQPGARQNPYIGAPVDGWTRQPVPPMAAAQAAASAPRS